MPTNLFTVSAVSLSATYSADVQPLSANYVVSLGSFTTTNSSYPTITTNAPYTKVKVTPIMPKSPPYTTSRLLFFFTDPWDSATINTTYSAISANGLLHTYQHSGSYAIVMNVSGSNPSIIWPVAQLVINEIPASPVIRAFDLSGVNVSSGVHGTSPFTLNFCSSGTRAGSFPIENIIWSFDDNSTAEVTRYETTTANQITAFTDLTDPRNYIVTHTFYRNLPSSDPNFNIRFKTVSMTTSAMYQSPAFTIGNVDLAATPIFRLIKSRMYDSNDKLLFVTETADANSNVFLHSLI